MFSKRQPEHRELARAVAKELKRQERGPGLFSSLLRFLFITLPGSVLHLIGLFVLVLVAWVVLTTPT